MKNDFGATVIVGDGPLDFHLPARQGVQVAKLISIGGKDHGGERALAIVWTKIEKRIASARRESTQHAPRDAACLTQARLGEVKIHTAALGVRRPRGTRVPQPEPIGHQRRQRGHHQQGREERKRLFPRQLQVSPNTH